MALRRCKKTEKGFSMSSMTDIVFLLLIFFMVTSTLINPNALKLLLPKSTNQTSSHPQVTISIDKKINYYFNHKVTNFSSLETKAIETLKGTEDPTISIEADKSVDLEYVVKVMNIAKRNNYKTILSTSPE